MRLDRLRPLVLPALFLFGCSDDGSLFTPCGTSADCAAGNSCVAGFCTPSDDGRGGRDTGTAGDTGGTDTSNPGLDVGTGDDVSTLDIPVSEDTGECVPNCAGLECGEDGCGGSCGFCSGTETCMSGVCQGGGGGGDSCPDIIECINASDGSEGALNAGIGAGTAEAQGQIEAIIVCLQSNCGEPGMSDEEFTECQQAFCSDELAECTGMGTGSANCTSVFECLLGCPDQECGNACISTGTPEAQNAAINYYNCGVEACEDAATMEEFVSCTEANCSAEAAECRAS